jgi:hypothetical protein
MPRKLVIAREEPGTGVDIISRRIWPFGVHLRELTLSACQALFGGSQQPLHGLGAVAFDGVPIVIQTAVAEDTKIELRGGVAALGGKNEVFDSAALHQCILTTRGGLLLLSLHSTRASATILNARLMRQGCLSRVF